jgi:ion channel-forming bestrophin family protein
MIAPGKRSIYLMVRYTGPALLALAVFDVLVVLAYRTLHWQWVALPHIPLALYGGGIGVIVGFRNQSAYARWWEARTLWGSIVNNARCWARDVMSISAQAQEQQTLREQQRLLVTLQIAWVHALRQHLRKLDVAAELPRWLAPAELDQTMGQKNIPLTLQVIMGRILAECRLRGWIDSLEWQALEGSLNDLMDAQGGCERIKNTPMPKLYDYFPHLFVHVFCLLLPLALVANMGWFTPVGSALVGFIFLTLDQIGRDLENPFDNTVFDVPLTSITNTIEINLLQVLGQTDLPAAVVPVQGILW